jgi:glycosyltransferase involved in cell wall biosynthesis
LLKNIVDISIIITTYNREKNLFKIISLLSKQNNILKNNIEIIICDSNSKKKNSILTYIKNFLNLNIFYYNCPINHQAYKRNYGAKKSKGRYLVFIDDDCFPDSNFLYNYLNILKLNRNRAIYCGLVKYVVFNKIKNLILYRQSRLISSKDEMQNSIPPKNFISMNMALNKHDILFKKKYLFNNKFRFYGFEDYEFAYRLERRFYKFYLTKALIYHNDQRTFDDFLRKYHFLGNFGIMDIIRINFPAAKDTIYYKIEKNFIIALILKIPGIFSILNFIEHLIIVTESKIKIYLPILYKTGIFIAYLKGILQRYSKYKNTYLINHNNWYK